MDKEEQDKRIFIDKYGYLNDIYKDYKYNDIKLLERVKYHSDEFYKIAHDISLFKNPKNILYYGSGDFQRFRNYAGDIDIWEKIEKKYLNNYKLLSSRVKKTVNEIYNMENFRFVELKAGVDKALKIYIGYYQNGKINKYNYRYVLEQIESKGENKKLYKEIIPLVKQNITIIDWFNLYEGIRKLYTVRWNHKEVMEEKKVMLSSNTITLEEIFRAGSIVKIDTITLYNNKWIGCDNYIDIGLHDITSFFNTLSRSMLIFYFNKNYIKFSSRLLSLIRTYYPRQEDLIIKLYILFSSKKMLLKKVRNVIKYINYYIELSKQQNKKIDNDLLYNIYESILNKISIIPIEPETQKIIYYIKDNVEKIEKIIKKKKHNYESIFSKNEKMAETIFDYLNKYIYDYMTKNGIIPLKRRYFNFVTDSE